MKFKLNELITPAHANEGSIKMHGDLLKRAREGDLEAIETLKGMKVKLWVRGERIA